MSISTQVAGSCLFNAIVAVILVTVGGKVGYSHAFWAAAAFISLWIVPKVVRKRYSSLSGKHPVNRKIVHVFLSPQPFA